MPSLPSLGLIETILVGALICAMILIISTAVVALYRDIRGPKDRR
jgi:hypothetical protein